MNNFAIWCHLILYITSYMWLLKLSDKRSQMVAQLWWGPLYSQLYHHLWSGLQDFTCKKLNFGKLYVGPNNHQWVSFLLSFTCERLKVTCDESQLTHMTSHQLWGATDQLLDKWTKLGLLPQNQLFLEKSSSESVLLCQQSCSIYSLWGALRCKR